MNNNLRTKKVLFFLCFSFLLISYSFWYFNYSPYIQRQHNTITTSGTDLGINSQSENDVTTNNINFEVASKFDGKLPQSIRYYNDKKILTFDKSLNREVIAKSVNENLFDNIEISSNGKYAYYLYDSDQDQKKLNQTCNIVILDLQSSKQLIKTSKGSCLRGASTPEVIWFENYAIIKYLGNSDEIINLKTFSTINGSEGSLYQSTPNGDIFYFRTNAKYFEATPPYEGLTFTKVVDDNLKVLRKFEGNDTDYYSFLCWSEQGAYINKSIITPQTTIEQVIFYNTGTNEISDECNGNSCLVAQRKECESKIQIPEENIVLRESSNLIQDKYGISKFNVTSIDKTKRYALITHESNIYILDIINQKLFFLFEGKNPNWILE